MKIKAVIFALSISLLMLGGCVASIGSGYGYYPSAQSYYGYGRPYYAPRPIILRPQYRQPYRSNYGGGYRSEGGYGGQRGGGNFGGGYHGGGGHSRGR